VLAAIALVLPAPVPERLLGQPERLGQLARPVRPESRRPRILATRLAGERATSHAPVA